MALAELAQRPGPGGRQLRGRHLLPALPAPETGHHSQIFLLDQDGTCRRKIKVEQQRDSASRITIDVSGVNVGGSKLMRRRLTLTLTLCQGLQAVEPPGWEEDTPNALVREASAVSHGLPTAGRNDRCQPPPLTLHEPEVRREAGSHRKGYNLR